MSDHLKQYRELLQHHDWTYEYSDDIRMWRAGKVQRDVINNLQPELDPDFELWNQYCPPEWKRKREAA